MPSILFICTANQFRSPLAAATLQDYLLINPKPGEWKIESAGTWTTDGRSPLPVTLQNADRLGIHGLEKHKSRQVSASLLNGFDLIIVMESGQKEALNVEFKEVRGRVLLLTEVVGEESGDIPDPIVLGMPTEDVATRVNKMVRDGAEKIFDLAKTFSLQQYRS